MINGVVKNIGKHSFVYGIGILFSKATGFVMIPIYTNYLNPTEYGIIGVLDFTVSIIGGIIGLRISNSIIYFYNCNGSKDEKNSVISTAILSLFVLTSIFAAILCSVSSPLSRMILKEASLFYYFVLVFITMVFGMVIEPAMVYIRLLERSVLYTIISITKLVLAVTLNIYFIVFLKFGVLGFLYSGLITAVSIALVACAWTLKNTGFKFSYTKFVEMAKYSLPLIPASFCMSILHSADVYVLTWLAGVYSVGLYALAYKFGMVISDAILMPFGLIWGTLVYKVIKQENGKEIIARVCTLFCAFLIWTALIIALFVEDIIRWMAETEFWQAHIAVPFVLLGYIFFALSTIFHFGSLYKKKTIYTFYSNVIAAITNITLNLLIIPLLEFKFLGAAITTAISFFLLAILRLRFSNKVLPIPFELKKLFLLFFWGTVLYAIGMLEVSDTAYVTLFLRGVLIIMYPAFWIFSKAIAVDEIKSLCRQVRHKFFRGYDDSRIISLRRTFN